MATSGSTSVSFTSWDTLKFSWSISGQSIDDNTSTVAWKLELVAGSSGKINSSESKSWSVSVDGNSYSGTNKINIGNNTSKVLASGTTTIAHNSDGSKTFNYSFYQQIKITFSGSYISSKSGSGSGVLDTIARASQPSCITWPEHTQNVGSFGDNIAIHMNRQSDALTHTVRYAFGAQTGTIATNVTTGTTWAIPLSLMNLIPDSVQGSGTIYVDTYNGGTLVGTKSCGFTATVPASVKPTCTATLDDTSGMDDIYGSPVKGLSKIKVVVNTTIAYGSSIQSCIIQANGVRYSGTTITTDALTTAGNSKITVTVTDGRGRTGAWEYTMSVLDYNIPTISRLTVHRCDANGAENDQGEYAKVTFTAEVAAMSNTNTSRYTIKYKKSSATTWTEVARTALNNQYAVTNHEYVFAADGNSTFNVELTVSDRHRTTIAATSVSTAFTLMNWHEDGRSIRFGGVAEESGVFQNDLELIQRGNRHAFSSAGIAGTAGYVLMAKIEVTAANADTPITFVLSRRAAPSTMTVWVRLNNSTATASALSTIQYEGTNYGAFLVKSSDLVWDFYVQKGSAYDTVTIQDWYTSRTMRSRVSVTFPGTLVDAVPEPFYRATPTKPQSLLDFMYPVGTIVHRYDHINPGTIYGGTWVRIYGAFLWASDENGEIGLTGGERTVALSEANLPTHSHAIPVANTATGSVAANNKIRFNNTASSFVGSVDSNATGSGTAHNNMPPYIQVSVWRRTA